MTSRSSSPMMALAASSMPFDSSPLIFLGARFATTMICFPTSCSGV